MEASTLQVKACLRAVCRTALVEGDLPRLLNLKQAQNDLI
jgi:hypothetical protein